MTHALINLRSFHRVALHVHRDATVANPPPMHGRPGSYAMVPHLQLAPYISATLCNPPKFF